MSAATRPAALKRPARPVATTPAPQAESRLSPQAVMRQRESKAYRAYVFARYEWLRLKAIGLGYLTPNGYTPLPLKGEEQLADVQAKVKTLNEWIKRNAPTEAEPEDATPSPEPEPDAAPVGKEAKRFDIPQNAKRVSCRSCGAPMYWVPTGNSFAPVNPDGTSHFATCPNADAHRSNKSVPLDARQPQRDAPVQSDVAPHVREFLDLATQKGLPHEKPHRTARLAAINKFLMDNEKEPIEGIKSIREQDMPLLKAGLQRQLLRWP